MNKLFFTVIALLAAGHIYAQSEFKVRLMPQFAFGGYNTVSNPNHTGTRFSLSRDLKAEHV